MMDEKRGWAALVVGDRAMYLGFILAGMVLGVMAGAVALMVGSTLWVALLTYAGMGLGGATLGIAVASLPTSRKLRLEPDYRKMNELVTEN